MGSDGFDRVVFLLPRVVFLLLLPSVFFFVSVFVFVFVLCLCLQPPQAAPQIFYDSSMSSKRFVQFVDALLVLFDQWLSLELERRGHELVLDCPVVGVEHNAARLLKLLHADLGGDARKVLHNGVVEPGRRRERVAFGRRAVLLGPLRAELWLEHGDGDDKRRFSVAVHQHVLRKAALLQLGLDALRRNVLALIDRRL